MRIVPIALALLAATPATAQLTNPGGGGASAADVAAAQNLASSAFTTATTAQQAASDAATAAANKCAPMAIVPPPEVIGGAAGSGANCRLANSVQPRITRSVAFTTAADGTATVTWVTLGAVPLVFPVANVATGATQVPACYPVIGTITATGATVQCYMTQTLLGLGLLPFAKATAGVTGQILAIPVS